MSAVSSKTRLQRGATVGACTLGSVTVLRRVGGIVLDLVIFDCGVRRVALGRTQD